MRSKIKKLPLMIVASIMFGFALLATVNISNEGEITYVLSAMASETGQLTQPEVKVELPGTTTTCNDCWCTTKGTHRVNCVNVSSTACYPGNKPFSHTFKDPNC